MDSFRLIQTPSDPSTANERDARSCHGSACSARFRMMVASVRYARNGDVALAYQVVGDGPIDLVFVPQWIGTVELTWDNPLYARFLKRLASFSRLILVDPRGTGLSERLSPRDVPPLEVMMEDLGAVMDAAGSDRAVLFGGSADGALCTLFAATHPERTTALIAYSTAPRGDYGNDYGLGHARVRTAHPRVGRPVLRRGPRTTPLVGEDAETLGESERDARARAGLA